MFSGTLRAKNRPGYIKPTENFNRREKKVCAFIPAGLVLPLPVENCTIFQTSALNLIESLSKIQSERETSKRFELLGFIFCIHLQMTAVPEVT